ncbi:MAG TPA: OPT/YSL family transporter, partial [Bacteroidota bacterium]
TLPAPQAGLMTVISTGIVNGDMAWPLLLIGMMFSLGLILIKSPSPTLIAVGMYLPFETTFAIFAGGVIKYMMDVSMKRRKLADEVRLTAENRGILLASGLVAGEALTGVLLAALFLANVTLPRIGDSPYVGLLVFPLLAYILIQIPLGGLLKRQ